MPHDELDRMCFVIFGIDFMQENRIPRYIVKKGQIQSELKQ